MSMECRDEVANLKQKLMGTKEEVICALDLLKKEEHCFLAQSLKQEIIALAGGDSIEICRIAGELLLNVDPGYVAGQSWLAMRLASVACSGTPLGQRLPLIAAMSELDEENQFFYIERCPDRDDIVAALMANNQWVPLLSLLRVSLLYWKYDVSALQDMFWLIRVLLKVKDNSYGKEAVVFSKPSDELKISSKVLGRILIDEAVSAAAGAWIRCLKGPGGDNVCLENVWVFEDEELAREVLESLAGEPVAFALFIKEMKQEDGVQKTQMLGVPDELLITFFTRGIMAAEYSLINLLPELLQIISIKPYLVKEFLATLEYSQDRIVAVAKALLAANQLPDSEDFMQLLKSIGTGPAQGKKQYY